MVGSICEETEVMEEWRQLTIKEYNRKRGLYVISCSWSINIGICRHWRAV